MQHISNFALITVLFLVLIPILVSHVQKLGLEKDILYSSIRGFIQLLLLGFFISYLFSFEKWYVILGYVFFMIVVASSSIFKRGDKSKNTFFIVFLSIFSTVSICLSLWLLLKIIPFEARYIIPVSGMFSGSAMVAASVALQTIHKGSSKKDAIRIAMIPTIDTLKTTGLVQIPGTMTGMILAGADPLESVKYQIFIIFTLLIVSSFSSIIIGYFLKNNSDINGKIEK